MIVDQILESAAPGDAVFHCVLSFREMLQRRNYQTRVYARLIHPALRKQVIAARHLGVQKGDILIYHFALGAETTRLVESQKGRAKIALVYHNVTPARYFRYEDPMLYCQLRDGRGELASLREVADLALADSDYNRRELLTMGYKEVGVVPPMLIGDLYRVTPDKGVLQRFGDGKVNLLFVGRIAPNKKQEDVIKSFYYYRQINPDSRLLLVGSLGTTQVYYRWLLDLVSYLGLEDVHFCGHVTQAELNAYYQVAKVFVSMSEHEGFCVPIVESMYFGVPIVAYKSSAVPETLGNGGILVKERDFPVIAEVIHLVISDRELRDSLLAKQKRELEKYSREVVEAKFWHFLSPLLNQG